MPSTRLRQHTRAAVSFTPSPFPPVSSVQCPRIVFLHGYSTPRPSLLYPLWQVLEADRLLYASEFPPEDVPDPVAAAVGGGTAAGGFTAAASIELVFAKLWDACREVWEI
jgi:hypothetical protein